MKELVQKFREENKGKWVWYNGAMGIDTALLNNYIEDTREQAVNMMALRDEVTIEEVENDYDDWYYIHPVEDIDDECFLKIIFKKNVRRRYNIKSSTIEKRICYR